MQRAGQDYVAALRHPARHKRRLRARRGPVVHRRVGNFHAGDQRHLGLKFEQVLQRSLRYFWLIGRVRRQKFTALNHVVNGRGYVMPVSPGAEKKRHTTRRCVFRRHCANRSLHLQLALMIRQVDGIGQAHSFGHVAKQAVD